MLILVFLSFSFNLYLLLRAFNYIWMEKARYIFLIVSLSLFTIKARFRSSYGEILT